jgi:hypothetical protein
VTVENGAGQRGDRLDCRVLLLLPLALAAGPPADVRLPWTAVGFSPAGPESPAFGPDLLAAGPDGRWAAWDPVRGVVIGVATIPLPHVDGLAFTRDGDLLVLDESRRTLTRWHGGSEVASIAEDRLCPVGVELVVAGDLAAGRDVFGNLHPLAALGSGGLDAPSGPHLLPAPHVVRLEGGKVTVDGVAIVVPADTLGAHLLGDWLVADAGRPGAVRERVAISLATGRSVAIPTKGRYRPASGLAAAPDGALAYLDPRDDGLHVVRVAP